MCAGFWWESPWERGYLKDQGVDEIKMDLRELGCGDVEWIHLAQDRDRRQALVNAVMNLHVLAPHS
jgi:alpha-glucosidase (family GH31 glycosyl hydrolase)